MGVAFDRGGEPEVARARAEVILCGGAVNSPQLLQLSGVGPGALLRRHGVDVVADRADVGEGLQDHYMTGARYRLKPGAVTVNEASHGWRFMREALRYAVLRQRPAHPVGGARRRLRQVAAGPGHPRHPVPHPARHGGP